MFLLYVVLLLVQILKGLGCDSDRGIKEVTENGEKFIQCDGTKAYNVFINSVRSTDGVNLTTVDSTGQLKVTGCLTGTPDVFNYEGNERTWYCRPGCSPLHGRQWNITYPREIVSLEPSSPPIIVSSEHSVTVSCAPGYAQVFGEKKETTSLCTDNGWSNKESSFITCKRGCPNLEEEIANAIVNTTKTFQVGQVPFSTGDTISIFCNKGYTLVGESPLTCNSLNRWQISQTPQCVKA
ncbi:hypothetical protein ACHWQZ_G002814 [Mnemiopsis leidyi]